MYVILVSQVWRKIKVPLLAKTYMPTYVYTIRGQFKVLLSKPFRSYRPKYLHFTIESQDFSNKPKYPNILTISIQPIINWLLIRS